MCVQIYLGSLRALPEIAWTDTMPEFYVKALTDAVSFTDLQCILKTPHLYELGSFMGCSCGLIYNSQLKEDDADNYPARLKDAASFQLYLAQNLTENSLKLFSTWWEIFPEKYQEEILSLSAISDNEFELPEDIVLSVTM